MNKKSYLVTVICLLLAFSIFSTTTAMAASTTDPVYMNDINVFNEDELVIAPQSGAIAAKVLCFFKRFTYWICYRGHIHLRHRALSRRINSRPN